MIEILQTDMILKLCFIITYILLIVVPFLEWYKIYKHNRYEAIRHENADKYYAKRKLELEVANLHNKELKKKNTHDFLKLGKTKILQILEDDSNSKFYYAELGMNKDDFESYKKTSENIKLKYPMHSLTLLEYYYVNGEIVVPDTLNNREHHTQRIACNTELNKKFMEL